MDPKSFRKALMAIPVLSVTLAQRMGVGVATVERWRSGKTYPCFPDARMDFVRLARG